MNDDFEFPEDEPKASPKGRKAKSAVEDAAQPDETVNLLDGGSRNSTRWTWTGSLTR